MMGTLTSFQAWSPPTEHQGARTAIAAIRSGSQSRSIRIAWRNGSGMFVTMHLHCWRSTSWCTWSSSEVSIAMSITSFRKPGARLILAQSRLPRNYRKSQVMPTSKQFTVWDSIWRGATINSSGMTCSRSRANLSNRPTSGVCIISI